MTSAVPTPTPSNQSTASHAAPLLILGTDALLAALPATPVQLAHACMQAGFSTVIPASWGDELIAGEVLRRLRPLPPGPVIQCSCPIVAQRLLAAGSDLRPVLLPLVSPPVAVSRYLRSLTRPKAAHITYVGACPGAVDESIDVRLSPDALMAMLAEQGIVAHEQPRVFDSIIPPDRRRFLSQPGGLPTTEALWTEAGSRSLVEVGGHDYVAEIAQHLLTGKNVLIDVSARLGCVCSGAVSGTKNPRSDVVRLEPPRSSTPVVDEQPPIDLGMPITAVPRSTLEFIAAPTAGTEEPFGNRFSPTRAQAAVPEPRVVEARAPRQSGPVATRPILGGLPVARDIEGKALPRAYVARRRSSPRGISVVVQPDQPVPVPVPQEHEPAATTEESVVPSPPSLPREVTQPLRAVKPPVESYTPALTPSIIPPVEPVERFQPVQRPAPVAPAERELANPVQPPTARVATAAVLSPPRDPSAVVSPVEPPVVRRRPMPHSPPPATITRAQLVGILIGVVMLAICASTVVAVIVGRSMTASSASAPSAR